MSTVDRPYFHHMDVDSIEVLSNVSPNGVIIGRKEYICK
jgi:hypothetical protein